MEFGLALAELSLPVPICLLSFTACISCWLVCRMTQQDRLYHVLINAIKHNHAPAVFLLLQEGADPDARDRATKSFTPVQYVETLFQRMRGKQPLSESTAPTALLTALQSWWKPEGGSDRPPENTTIVEMLLRRRVEVNCKDSDGVTPLIEAALSDREDIVRLLLEQGADVHPKDKYGFTALGYVDGRNQHLYSEAIMRLLKRAGATESD